VPAYGPERETHGGRRQVGLATAAMLVALLTPHVPESLQEQAAFTLQATALKPFIATQQRLGEARVRAEELESLRVELDALTAAISTQAALADENRALRELVGLGQRLAPSFHPATVLRPGTTGSESMFLVDVGYEQGVRPGATVISARGLVGVIRDVRSASALGMDWAHPDFRASAMLDDGSTFGIVENVRGSFREQDRLILNGTAYHEHVPVGTLVLTSGLGGVFPRGIPIGQIESTAEEQGTWLRSYWLRPAVQPGSVTHVLVQTEGGARDLSSVWTADSAWVMPVVPTPPPSEGPRPPGATTDDPPGGATGQSVPPGSDP
jgi:rod shape-determining protein MreC